MELKHLRYFKRVADTGSVSRAAAALSVAQPAVSRQISNLEELLGTPLFFRNGRGVTLTDAGEQLYAHASQILDAVRSAEEDVRDSIGVARGSILIGSMPSIVERIAPPLLKLVERQHPDLSLEFTAAFSGTVNEWLSNGLLDVAIIHDATRTQHFLTEPLVQEDLVAATRDARPGPVDLATLAGEKLILPRQNHGLRLQIERVAAQERVDIIPRFEVDCLGAVRRLLEEGYGTAVLPRAVAEGFEVRSIGDPPMMRQLLLATSSQRPVSQTTRMVIQEIKREVKRLIAAGKWRGAHNGRDGLRAVATEGAREGALDQAA